LVVKIFPYLALLATCTTGVTLNNTAVSAPDAFVDASMLALHPKIVAPRAKAPSPARAMIRRGR